MNSQKMETYIKEFNEWIADGNVSMIDGRYSTQDAQYRNRIKSKLEFCTFFFSTQSISAKSVLPV